MVQIKSELNIVFFFLPRMEIRAPDARALYAQRKILSTFCVRTNARALFFLRARTARTTYIKHTY